MSLESNLQSLCLLAQLHDMAADPRQLAHELGEERAGDGLDAGDAVRLLHGLGFDARLQRGGWKALARAECPLLAGTRSGDWLLVGRVQSHAVVVQRPGASGPERLGRKEFEAQWSGQWLSARRTAAAAANNEPAMNKFGIGWFWNSMKKYRLLMGEVLLASLFAQVFALLTPLIFQVVIDKVLTHRTLSTLDVMVVALLGVSLFEVVLGAMRHYLFSHTTNRIDVELGARLFRHLLQLPLSYFESRRSGDTVARVRELDNARAFLTGQALTSWLDLLFALVFISVMFCYSVTLTLIVLAALPLLFGASWLITPVLRRKLEDKFAMGAENQAFLVETVSAMETLKGQAAEPLWQRQWERRLADYVNTAFHSGHMASATNQFVGFMSKLLSVALLYFGARLVIDGDLTVGGLIAFNMLSSRVNAPILKLSSLWQDFTQMKVSIKRLADIMDAPVEPGLRAQRAALPDLQGQVRFENVSFRYAQNRPEVLRDLTLDVAAGEVIGVVGVSGAGKTSLMRLLQNLYAPERGRILVDGVDLHLMDASWLRRQIGVVGQDALLFNRSVRENIALAQPGLGMESVMDAARLAGAHDFILELPDGYDTLIGERGSKLSGGQRARIAIARALATDPRLLLLDEATASLDYESERVIHDGMAQICAGRTVFIVAHRLPTLRLADRIIVLERGQLIETGSHAQLMQLGGRYASLYRAHQVLDLPVQPSPASPPAAGAAPRLEVAHG